MKKQQIFLAILALSGSLFMSTSALAQTTGGNGDDFKQPSTTLTPIYNNGGTTGGGGSASGTTYARIEYRTRLDSNCPAGMVGNSEYTQKMYTRPNGTTFEEPWYLTKNNCTRQADTTFTQPQYDQAAAIVTTGGANIVNAMNSTGLNGAQNAQIQSIVSAGASQGAQGSITSPSFYETFSQTYNFTGGPTNGGMSICVGGFPGPNPVYTVRGLPTGALFGYELYPGWLARATYNPNNGTWNATMCPAGSFIQTLEKRTITYPEGGGIE